MAHLSRWIESHGLDPGGLDLELVEEFLADRWADGYVLWRSATGITPILGFLRSTGVVSVAETAGPATSVDTLRILHQ